MACPVCSKDSVPEYRPFCSKGCTSVDLNRWLTGSYAIDETGEITHNSDLHDEDISNNDE